MTHAVLTLPVPSPMLSPNARPHYMAKAKVTKQHRQAAKLVAMGALNRDEPEKVYEAIKSHIERITT